MDSIVVDLDSPLDMDNTPAHPDSEAQEIDNAIDNQQVGDVIKTATTLVVKKGKEAKSRYEKAPKQTGPLWLEKTLSNKKRNIVPTSI